MAYLIGSSSTSAYTVANTYNNNATYAMFSGDNTQGIVAATSGTAARLNLYINSWTSASLKACLYDNTNTLVNSVIVPSSVGTGLQSIIFPNTTITAGDKYRLAIYLVAAGGVSLWTKTGALFKRDVSTGSYTSPVTTLPNGAYVSTNEFYWSMETAPAYSIDSIDTDDIVEIGQTFTISTAGFTNQPVATNDQSANGVVITITGGSNNLWTAVVTDRVSGSPLPLLPLTPIMLTLTNGSQVATRNLSLTKKSTETLRVFTNANILDQTFLTYHLAADGFTVEGGSFWYIVPVGMSDLLVTSRGLIEVTEIGTFDSYFRPVTGTGAGNVYFYRWTITEQGQIIAINLSSIFVQSESPKYDGSYFAIDRP